MEGQHPLTEKLLNIMAEKKTNLCVAADGMTLTRVITLIEKIGEHICVLKVHLRHIGLNQEEIMDVLYDYKKRYNFLLLEDAKLYDCGRTIERTYAMAHVKHMDLVTVSHPDDESMKAIKRAVQNARLPDDEPRGCIVVCDVSFRKNFPQDLALEYLSVAERNSDICIGVVSQKMPKKPGLLKFVPGVNISSKTDGMGQNWRSPSDIKKDGVDIFIVGSGITSLPDNEWELAALKYKEMCYVG